MKPAPFDYRSPATLDDVVTALAEQPGARVLAGGQSLLPALARRALRPPLLVDLRAVPGLDRIDRTSQATLFIGARVTQRQIERDHALAGECPLLAETIRRVGHPQTRTRGTLVGGLAHADPAAELPALLVALDGVVHARGPRGDRRIGADAFYLGPGRTALAPDEVAVAVEIPSATTTPSPAVPTGTPGDAGGGTDDTGDLAVGGACVEVAPRATVALCGALATVARRADGTVAAARIALFGVAARPVRARRAERAVLDGGPLDPALIALLTREDLDAARAADAELPDGEGGTNGASGTNGAAGAGADGGDYCREVAGELVHRAIDRALVAAR
ncbi:xanthine dehydrogenase family protein subunit M [Parafrankia sp. EUN1f]|uniref:FAD binding domain-containing protein n=1 Tax=Parafrankia sp. EUN1f TaxID=102897 RepID=UPI0001C45E7A|nr:FAD binding domain-containing protein [Parafrankia sp. EUN1f]EFC82783.1 molybdopterin dehydrogenase FAD-binding [Parafrankia sp. EUN1f]